MKGFAFDSAALTTAIKAGHGAALLRSLEDQGIVFDASLGVVDFLVADPKALRFRRVGRADGSIGLACDAQPQLVTTSNAGIPQYLTNYIDPKLIEVLVTPMKFAQILGEQQKGDWLSTTVTFKVREFTGEVSSYGDYNNNGSAGQNLNFPQIQAYHYQTITQWGQKEAAEAGLVAVDWASGLNIASALVLNKFQNKSYAYGIDGLQTFGILNHPALSAPINATAQWNLAGTSADTVYEDVRRMWVQAQAQLNGLVDSESAATLAMSPQIAMALNKTNQFQVNVWDNLKKNFPNMRVETAPEYATESGGLVQLIFDSVEGQKVATAAYTEKMRAHNIVTDLSAWKQKKSQGTLGTVVFLPIGIVQMTAVQA